MTATGITRRRLGLGFAGVLSLLAGGCLGSITGGDDHEHEHDDPPWEWGGLYDLEQGTYPYTYDDGPDPDMHLAVVPTDEDGDHGLFHAGETATELFENDEGETVSDGDPVQPSSETLYHVDFESEGETTIELEVESAGRYSLFTAHVPDEFDAELRSETGEELMPTVTEQHSSHSHDDDEGHGHDDEHEH